MAEALLSMGATLWNGLESCLTDVLLTTAKSITMGMFDGKSAVAAVAAVAAVTTLHSTSSGLTAAEMLAAPRRGTALPNPSGEWAVFTETSYSWETHKTSTIWQVMDLSNGKTSILYDGSDISEIVWAGPSATSILYINTTNAAADGGISIYATDILKMSQSYLVMSLPAPYEGLKAAKAPNGNINFLMNCKAYPNGTAYNPQTAVKPYSTARIYTDIYVRHWDYYLDENLRAVFAGTLSGGTKISSTGPLRNLVTGIKNITKAECPIGPFFDPSDYTISPEGKNVLFKTMNVDLNRADHTSHILYLVPHDGSSPAMPVNAFTAPSTPKNARGQVSSPQFSPDGTKLAYVQLDSIYYEADRGRMYLANVDPDDFSISGLVGDWDVSPTSIRWSTNGSAVIVAAADRGQDRLFYIPLDAGTSTSYVPANITDQGAVSDFHVLPNDDILVSDSKVYTSRDIYIINPMGDIISILFQANKVDDALQGMGPQDVSEFYFQGDWTQVHSLIVYPKNFNSSQKYPLAFLIHGGPEGQWTNAWSTRWNLKLWADQGYVVVAPNPSGSIGFGQKFTDSVANNWGSRPYEDIVKCWEYVDANLNYIDTSRGIAAGGSYGGYMTNWIQGMPLGRKFRALVTHDGSTSTLNQYASDELGFLKHDFGGTLWDEEANYERYNPLKNIKNFKTPQLVIHSDLDYRLPVSEGILLFNILQERGVPSKFLNFPDENHWVLKRENSLLWHEVVFEWINYYSGLSTVSPFERS